MAKRFLVLVILALLGCGGVSDLEADPEMRPGNPYPPMAQDLWDPGRLGPLAWWTADPRFLTLASSEVSRWRNRVDGRSGVLNNRDANPPTWLSAPQGSLPMVDFDSSDRLEEETSLGASNRAYVIDALSGTNTPFSILFTAQPTSIAAEQIFLNWKSNANSSVISVRITFAGDVLKVTRGDDAGSFAEATGTVQLGTSIRRIGITFDGARLRTYVDGQADADAAAGGQGVLTLNQFRLGATDGPVAMRVGELVVLPRAIGYNEWLHYYEYSAKKWGPIQPPRFLAAGSGTDVLTSGTLSVPYPSHVAGDLLVLAVGSRQETVAPGALSGWTLGYGPDTNPNATGRLYFRISDGDPGSPLSYTTGTANMWAAQMYAFRGVSGALTTAGYTESGTTTEVDGPGSLTAPTIRPNGYGRLAVAVTFMDNNPGLSPFTGATGGTWAEATEYTTGTGSNFGIQLQVAALPSAIPISGGSLTLSGSDSAITRGFALIGN